MCSYFPGITRHQWNFSAPSFDRFLSDGLFCLRHTQHHSLEQVRNLKYFLLIFKFYTWYEGIFPLKCVSPKVLHTFWNSTCIQRNTSFMPSEKFPIKSFILKSQSKQVYFTIFTACFYQLNKKAICNFMNCQEFIELKVTDLLLVSLKISD